MLAHAPLQDPILSFLHTFSLKSAHVGGQNPPKMGPRPPYGKSWIRPWTRALFLQSIFLLFIDHPEKELSI